MAAETGQGGGGGRPTAACSGCTPATPAQARATGSSSGLGGGLILLLLARSGRSRLAGLLLRRRSLLQLLLKLLQGRSARFQMSLRSAPGSCEREQPSATLGSSSSEGECTGMSAPCGGRRHLARCMFGNWAAHCWLCCGSCEVTKTLPACRGAGAARGMPSITCTLGTSPARRQASHLCCRLEVLDGLAQALAQLGQLAGACRDCAEGTKSCRAVAGQLHAC